MDKPLKRLSDEDIEEAVNIEVYDYFQECEKRECVAGNSRESGFDCDGRYLSRCEYYQRTITEQRRNVTRKAEDERDKEWIKWGDEPCPHKTTLLEFRSRRYCEVCLQELKLALQEEGE